MANVNQFLQDKLLPVAGKLGANKFLIGIRDGIALTMPLIIIGSLLMIIVSFPVPGWSEWLGEVGVAGYFWKGVSSSFGLAGLIASFGIAHSVTTQYNVDGLASGVVSLSAFITVTPFMETGLPTDVLGARGLLVAILLGLTNGYVYQWFINRNIKITLPDSVPPAVAKSFSAVIPGAVIIISWLLVFSLLDRFGLPQIHDLAQVVLGKPLGLLGNTVIGVSIIVGLNSLFWFIGIHGAHVVSPVVSPIWLGNLEENSTAFGVGEQLQHIFTTSFMDNFVFIGGGGATLGLVIALFYLSRKKKASQQAKVLSPLTLVPGMFNINEPAIFGLPIVLNVLLLVPFVLAPMINLFISYFAMFVGLVPLTYTSPSWTMPPILSGVLATGSFRGSLLQIVLIIVNILLYLPFVMAVEKKYKEDELNS